MTTFLGIRNTLTQHATLRLQLVNEILRKDLDDMIRSYKVVLIDFYKMSKIFKTVMLTVTLLAL